MKKALAASLIIFFLLSQFTTISLGEREAFACGVAAPISHLLGRTYLTSYSQWIEKLSGEQPVRIAGVPHQLLTRFTPAMFRTQSQNARAFDFVEQQVRHWYHASQISIHEYPIWDFTAKNLIVEIPGAMTPDEIVILSAHLDSTSIQSSYDYAPGADDNGTGSAALLEAARLLRNYRFNRTLRLIWFTGEEQGLYGSNYYTISPDANLNQVIGVVNLDMFGYDGDSDRCFELHVGTLAASDAIGQCFTSTISAYGFDLQYDYITAGATRASDHRPFWDAYVGAVEVLENAYNNASGTCVGVDSNPNYHKVTDTIANMHPGYAFEIAKAAIATAANLAGASETCLAGTAPQFNSADVLTGGINLAWGTVQEALGYRVLRSSERCEGEIDRSVDLAQSNWVDHALSHNQVYHYWVEAISPNGCFSLPSGCATLTAQMRVQYFPMVEK